MMMHVKDWKQTRVQETTEAVVLQPRALALTVQLLVNVNLDSKEMDTRVQVNLYILRNLLLL